MKLNNTKKVKGLTLIEITLVIAVLLGLISVLFIGVSAYREGSNRAKCILNISSYQKAVRSYQNLYEASGTYNVADIAGTGNLLETFPSCPSAGVYTPTSTATAVAFPGVGTAALVCSLATANEHEPANTDGW